MKTYEAMFLLDADNSDFESACVPVREVLERAEAEVLTIKPWDDRRLAYEIKGRKRGLYVLTYFKADPGRMRDMQHDIQLSDRLLRAMILSADHVSDEQISADTPATLAATRQAAVEAERAAKKEAEAAEQASKETASGEPTSTQETTEISETPEMADEPKKSSEEGSSEEQPSEEPDTTDQDKQT